MGSIIKTFLGVILVLVVGSYIVDSRPVSNALQTGQQTGTDPLVAGAKAVKREIRVLTDTAHQEVYSRAVKGGLKKAEDLIDSYVNEDKPGTAKAGSNGSSL